MSGPKNPRANKLPIRSGFGLFALANLCGLLVKVLATGLMPTSAHAQAAVERIRLPGKLVWADYHNTRDFMTADNPDAICLALKDRGGYTSRYVGCLGGEPRCVCTLHSDFSLEDFPIGYPFRGSHCPEGYAGRQGTYTGFNDFPGAGGRNNRWYGPGTLQCIAFGNVNEVDRTQKPHPSCRASVGNPIDPMRGTKRQSITLDIGLLGRPLVLTYDSSDLLQGALPTPAFGYPIQHSNDFVMRTVSGTPGLPRGWFLNAFKRMHMGEFLSGEFRATKAVRGNGDVVSFERLNWYNTIKEPDVLDLAQWSGNLLYFDAMALSQEFYRLSRDARHAYVSTVRHRDGSEVRFLYSTEATPPDVAPAPDYLIGMVDDLGRAVSFRYIALPNGQPQDGRLTGITGADGTSVGLEYDALGRLVAIRWADGSVKRLLYEDPRFQTALTGVIDERGARVGTYAYGSGGEAIETIGADGTARHAVRYSRTPSIVMREQFNAAANTITRIFEWLEPVQASIVKPNGAQHEVRSTLVNGAPMSVADDQPAGSGCNAATQTRELDANGMATTVVDVSGYRRCMVNDPTRQFVMVQVDGLPGAAHCAAVVAAGAPLPPGSRKLTHEWHPQWRLKTKTFEPGKVSTFVYNGQPDPTRNGAIANCAPGAPRFADDVVAPLLCTEVEAPTLDLDGSLGAAAPLDATAPARERRYTYNAKGRRTSVTDERGNTTNYLYHVADSANARAGDLWQVVNPLGHRITFERYDPAGRLLRQLDENGVATEYGYDPRGRLVSTTTAGVTTMLERDPTGAIRRVIQPDGSWLRMELDAAARLVAVEDSAGNRIEYTLDSEGNRVAERALDPERQLRRTLARTFDALGRLATELGVAP